MHQSVKKNDPAVIAHDKHHPRIIPMQKLREHSRKILLAMILFTYLVLVYAASR